MNEHTLPGDLPGLVRRGAPVMLMHRVGVVVEDPLGCTSVLVVVEAGEDDESEPAAMSCISLSRLALDLTDPTGRIHALWWLLRLDDADTDPIIAFETSGKRWEHIVGAVVTATDDLTPDDLVAFTRVLRAAAEVARG